MTENQWPKTSDPDPAMPWTPAGGMTRPTTPDSMPSKTDIVKDEAANVAGQAAGAARNVTETARAEAASVAAEVKAGTRDLLHQAESDLAGQAGPQQQKAAEGIRSLSSQLRTMTDASDEQGIAADRSESVASWPGPDGDPLEAVEPDFALRPGRLSPGRTGTDPEPGARRSPGVCGPLS